VIAEVHSVLVAVWYTSAVWFFDLVGIGF